MDAPSEVSRLPLTSADPLAERLGQLRALFPEAESEGRLDLEKLRAVLGEGAANAGGVASGPERYGLSWAGKSDALKAIQTLTTATLRPAPSESEKWDTTGHAIIEGDNLEVLKVLQHAYARDGGKVKLIYIDPPYNTGGDFIYPDNYAEGLGSYLTYLGQVKDGIKQTTNLDTSGRYHSRWLTMIYPRLFLAKNLLRQDGVIFVSIDDHEVSNLRMVMDEIFGEENFLACIVWEKGKKGDPRYFSETHEYVVAYGRNEAALRADDTRWRKAKSGVDKVLAHYDDLRGEYQNDHSRIRDEVMKWFRSLPPTDPAKAHKHYNWSDERGLYFPDNFHGPDDGRESRPRYDIFHPLTGKPCAKPSTGWRWEEERTKWALAQIPLRIHFGPDETTIPCRKTYLFESDQEAFPTVIYKDGRAATLQVEQLLGKGVFDFPKDTGVIADLVGLVSKPKDGEIILDFFGGSGTTAQAVLELNKEDGGNRRFIVVQLPEPTGREDFPTIAEITKERVRRVIKRMEGERSGELPIGDGTKPDLGFKVFKLAESNFAIWNPALAATTPEALAEQWKLSADNVRAGAGETALLYELMLKSGLPLDTPAKVQDVAGARVHLLDEGRMLICTARELTREQLRGMAELKPQAVLCLDVAFKGNDALKVNADLEFQSHGIKFRTA